jgi:hypothetical protein
MVSAGGTIEGVNGDVWVRWRRLGADGGGGGGWRSAKRGGGGGDCYFLGWPMFLVSEVRRQGVFSMLFMLSNLTSENTCRKRGSRLINNNWRMEEWKRLGPSYPAAQVRPTTERNEVNEVTQFFREVGEFLREAFWCSNL